MENVTRDALDFGNIHGITGFTALVSGLTPMDSQWFKVVSRSHVDLYMAKI